VLKGLHEREAADPWKPVGELLGHIASRPGVKQVAVVDAGGRIVAVGTRHTGAAQGGHGSPAEHGHRPGDLIEGSSLPLGPRAIVDAVLASGERFGGADPRSSDGGGLYAVPVELRGRRHVLTVVKEPGILRGQLADMRWILVATLGAGLLLSFPLFYLLGGRSLSARHRAAVRSSTEDALTGIGNHRAFHEELRRQVEIAQRRERDVTVVVLDVDGFKDVNDTRGHGCGDQVLPRVGRILAGGRPEDRPFRMGGDEFAVILPDTDAAAASVAAERLRARVQREARGVTVSVGLAQLGAPARDRETLLACADMALYEAKRGGRNQVCSFAELNRPPAEVYDLARRRIA
jgi:diguanylate cyclase (GGDEF)-like protein